MSNTPQTVRSMSSLNLAMFVKLVQCHRTEFTKCTKLLLSASYRLTAEYKWHHTTSCNIRPEDTYRRKIKLNPKTTGQRLNRALHAFNRLYQASTFGGLSNIGSTKTLLLSASVKTLKLTYVTFARKIHIDG